MKFDKPSLENQFFDLAQIDQSSVQIVRKKGHDLSDCMMSLTISITGEVQEHERSIYTTMDLIGDLGGVHELIVIFFSIFMSSVSEHSFVSKALGILYLVRTKETDLFEKPISSKTHNYKNWMKCLQDK